MLLIVNYKENLTANEKTEIEDQSPLEGFDNLIRFHIPDKQINEINLFGYLNNQDMQISLKDQNYYIKLVSNLLKEKEKLTKEVEQLKAERNYQSSLNKMLFS
jgi:hypothetical protein